MSAPRLLRALVPIVVVGLAAAGCGTSGRELREPPPGATAPPRKAAPAGTLPQANSLDHTTFGLATDAWTPGGEIPRQYTCDGSNTSPPIAVFAPPAGTVELDLVVTDLDVNYVHWIVAGMAATSASFSAGEVPPGAVQAATTAGGVGYTGPCPPTGEQHTYEFALYALAAPSGVTPGQDAASAVAAITATPLETATITGYYER